MARDVHGWALPQSKLDFMARSTPTSASITVDRSSDESAPFMFECEAVVGAPDLVTRVSSGRTYETEHNYCRAVRTRTYVVGGPDKFVEAQTALQSVIGGMDSAVAIVGVPVLGRPEVVVEIEAAAVAASR
jgi:hypothetical protein